MAAIHGFWNMLPLGESVIDLLGLLPLGPKLSCPTEAVMTSRYWFSLSVPDGGVVHLATSSSAMWEVMWVVVSIKSCPLTGSNRTWLNRVVWGHQLVDPRWIAPKPQTTTLLVNVTCSHTVSLSSTTLPAKGQRSRLSSRLSPSAQCCSPLV